MKARCVFCWSELNIGERASEDYSGPVTCFCCGGMNDLKITKGVVSFINPLGVFEKEPRETERTHSSFAEATT